MVPPDLSDNQKTCPHCHQPLTPNVKFCETCGAKIEPTPVCTHCGSRLTPGVKFCETCGKPIGSQPSPAAPPAPVPIEVPPPPVTEPAVTAPEPVAPEKLPDKKPAKKSKETGKKVQKKTPVPLQETPPLSPPGPVSVFPENTPDTTLPENPVETVPAPVVAMPASPEEKVPSLAPEPASVAPENIPDRKIPEGPMDTVRKTTAPVSRTRNLAIAGVIGLVIVAALAYLVLLPMLSGQGSAGLGGGFSLPGSNPPPSAVPTVSAASAPSAALFETQPTQRMPANLEVTYQAERNNINGLVTVTFAGGPGMNGISQTVVTLTKSDGTVEKKTFKPKQTGDSVTLQGTLKTDRLEVIANYYTGDSYRVIDQLFEYKKKN
jgi:hypothetical protein